MGDVVGPDPLVLAVPLQLGLVARGDVFYIERWLRGGLTTGPYPNASAVLQRMFSVEVDVLLGPASEAKLQEPAQVLNLKSEITMAAHESCEHAAYAAGRAIDDMTIEQLQEDVVKVAREYPEKAPIGSFAEAKRIRDLAPSLLDRTGRPAQESDLYVAAGQACGILATVSFDLGYTDAASEHARTVFIFGRMVGYEGLCAWAMGMRALIANWSEFPLAALEWRHPSGGSCPCHAARDIDQAEDV